MTRALELRPDLLIVDISLGSGNSLEVIKRVKAANVNIKMLVLSGFQESLYAERSLRAGAMGYVNKQESNEKLLEAIRTILDGRRYVSAEVTQRLISQSLAKPSMAEHP